MIAGSERSCLDPLVLGEVPERMVPCRAYDRGDTSRAHFQAEQVGVVVHHHGCHRRGASLTSFHVGGDDLVALVETAYRDGLARGGQHGRSTVNFMPPHGIVAARDLIRGLVRANHSPRVLQVHNHKLQKRA